MTKHEGKAGPIDLKDVKALIAADEDYVRAALQEWFQAVLEEEMTAAIIVGVSALTTRARSPQRAACGAAIGRLCPTTDLGR